MPDECPSCHRLRRRLDRERAARAEAEAIAERVTRSALHDGLTGLPNRAQLLDLLVVALDRAVRRQAPFGVLFLDLDDFKAVNDSLGHDAGDRLLQLVAQRLLGSVRVSDVVARLGGDEFVVVCEDVSGEAELLGFAERIRVDLADPFRVSGTQLLVRASVGLRMADLDATAEELLAEADAAMYAAKRGGKGGVVVFDDRMREESQDRLGLERDLRDALDRDLLHVYYQPVVDLHRADVVGAEALVRWHHPVRGAVDPERFVAVAERSGLVLQLGETVLRRACRQAAEWGFGTRVDRVLHVNVSSREIEDAAYVPTVATALRSSGLPVGALCLEITERQLLADVEVVRANVRALHALGVHLAIDDFGVQYASLSALRRLPVTTLKIDRAFVAELGHSRGESDRRDSALVEAIAAMAGAFGLDTVAEGVERMEQAAELLALGVVRAQGWLFAAAVPAEQWPAALARSVERAEQVLRVVPLQMGALPTA